MNFSRVKSLRLKYGRKALEVSPKEIVQPDTKLSPKSPKITQLQPPSKPQIEKPKIVGLPKPQIQTQPKKTQVAKPAEMEVEVKKPPKEAKKDQFPILKQKYPSTDPDLIKDITEKAPENMVEWIVRSMQEKSGRWPEDLPRFITAYNFFKQNSKGNQRFQQLASIGRKTPKDLMSFTLHDVEDIEQQLKPTKQPSKRQQKKEHKKAGANKIYEEGGLQVIEIGGTGVNIKEAAKAACHYASGTKWCTSRSSTAENHLKRSPLYIIIDNGKKFQLHPASGQFMNDRDKPVEITPKVIDLIKKTGLLDKIWENPSVYNLKKFPLPEGVSEEELFLRTPESAVQYAKHKKKEWPEAEPLILTSPIAAVDYARNIKQRPWLEAEEVVKNNAEAAASYAVGVKGRRWPEVEEVIKKDPKQAVIYSSLLKNEFINGWPEAEPYIAKDGEAACKYSLKWNKKWDDIEVEKKIAKEGNLYEIYGYIENFPESKDIILTNAHAEFIYDYIVRSKKKGPAPEWMERLMMRDPKIALDYAKNILHRRFKLAEPYIKGSHEEKEYRKLFRNEFKKQNKLVPSKIRERGISPFEKQSPIVFEIPKGPIKEFGKPGSSIRNYGKIRKGATTQEKVLRVLNNLGSMYYIDLQRTSDISPMSLGQALVNLEARGLIHHERKKIGNKLRAIYSLTDLGKRVLPEIKPNWKKIRQQIEDLMDQAYLDTDYFQGLNEKQKNRMVQNNEDWRREGLEKIAYSYGMSVPKLKEEYLKHKDD